MHLAQLPEVTMARYFQIKDGEGFELSARVIHRIACCDCGLVHNVVLVASRDRKTIGIAVKRNNRATSARRRKALKTL